jgi:YD repeat-containing protein
MKQLILSALLLGLCYFGSYAQSTGNNTYFLPQIQQPSPNAISLGKYGDIPVSYYNGMPQISIPLLSLQTKSGFVLPIELNYHASGVKMDDLPSSVGMNWSLNAGGAITKTTRGLDDFGLTSNISEGYYWTEQRPPLPGGLASQCIFNSRAADGEVDIEPDLFYYNVTGASGKFIFKTNKSVLQLPYKDVDIKLQNLTYPVSYFSRPTWDIADAQGNIFNFDEAGVELSQTLGAVTGLAYTSSYFLTSIDTKAPSEQILFEYENYTHQYVPTEGHVHGVGFMLAETAGTVGEECENTMYSQQTSSTMKVYSKLLNKITYKGYTIEFTYSGTGITSQVKKLDEIVYKYNGAVYRKYKLEYTIETSKDRFWLIKVIDMDITNGSTNTNHAITYNEIDNLPRRLSGYTDKFGYYNQNANPHYSPKIPGIFYGTTYPDVDQSPDPARMLFGCIKDITYPTKGKTSFLFEAHVFKDDDNSPSIYRGAGLRIKEITSYAYASGATFQKQVFEYPTGKIMMMPNPYYYYVSGCDHMNLCRYYASSITGNISLSSAAMGSMVGYDKVTRMYVNESYIPNGKEEFEYMNTRPGIPYVANPGSATGLPTTQPIKLVPPGTPCSETFQSSQNGFLLVNTQYAYNGTFLPVAKTSYAIDPDAPADGITCSIFRYPYCSSDEPAYSDYDFCNRISQINYNLNGKVARPIIKETKVYDMLNGVPGSGFLTTTESYKYEKLQQTKVTVTKSNGQSITTDQAFPEHSSPYFSYATPLSLQKRIGGVLVDDIEYTYLTPSNTLVENVNVKENSELGRLNGNSTPLEDQTNVSYQYDAAGNLTGATPHNQPPLAFLWDDDTGKIMAEGANVAANDIAYTSFESTNASGRFEYNMLGISATARGGSKGYILSSVHYLTTYINKEGFYKISFWINTGFSNPGITLNNGTVVSQFTESYPGFNWSLRTYTLQIYGPCQVSVTGNGTIDEAKIHPVSSYLKTYVHHPFYGVLAACDEKATLKTYSYDAFGRLNEIRDHDGTVLQVLKYNLK